MIDRLIRLAKLSLPPFPASVKFSGLKSLFLSAGFGPLIWAFFVPGLIAAQVESHSQAGADSALHARAGDDSLRARVALDQEVALRARIGLGAALAGGLDAVCIGPEEIRRSGALYLDDLLRLCPFFISGDSLGSGYSKKFSSLGAGFDQVRLFLNGMPLNDPVTGDVDLRLVPPGIVDSIIIVHGAAFGGPQGGAVEVHLVTHPPDPPQARSVMGLVGGSFETSKLTGGLRRTLFRSGALHVHLNRISQKTRDFTRKAEQVQCFTRLEQAFGKSALLSLDCLFFSDDLSRGLGSLSRQKRKNLHLQLAFTGALNQKVGYRLGYRHSGSTHPSYIPGQLSGVEGHWDGYEGHLLFYPRPGLTAGLMVQGGRSALDRFPDSTLVSGTLASHSALGLVHYRGAGRFTVRASAGVRAAGRGKAAAVAELVASRPLARRLDLFLALKREALQNTRIYGPSFSEGSGNMTGKMSSAEAGLGFHLGPSGLIRAGALLRRLDQLVLSAYEPAVLSLVQSPPLDYRISGAFYRCSGALPVGAYLRAEGVELFNQPDHVPYLARRRHTATLGFERTFYQGDLTFTLEARAVYEGRLFFPVGEGPAGLLMPQPGRFNFGGTGTVRIINLTVYCRLDHLLSDYYNGYDPLPLPGPRALFGLSWNFFN